MEVTQQQLDDFKEMQAQYAEDLSKQTLKNNSNVTYGQLLSPAELKIAAISYSPELKTKASSIYSSEQLSKAQDTINWQNRVAPYDRAPVDYDMSERHPEYIKALTYFNSPEGQAESQNFNLKGTEFPLSKPNEPFGIEKAKKIAARGFDPANELQFESFKDGVGFRSKLAFAPRNMTVEDFKNLGEQYGLTGDYKYINPSDPSLGLAFKPKGKDDYQLVNTPYVTAEDTYNFLVQEFPALAGDIALTFYGSKKFTSPFGLDDKVSKKVGKVLGLSGLSAAGAAGGDFLRLSAGVLMGAHDRDFDDILKESGMIGAWAFGGTALISGSAQVIPKVWKMITGKDVPPSYYEKIDDAMQDAKASERGEGGLASGILYGDAISVKEINEQVNDLAKRFNVDLNGYNPTMASGAGTTNAADLEILFLKYADDPGLREVYKQIKIGNQEVIDLFVKALNKNIGPEVTGEATGATLGVGIRELAQKDIDAFNDEAYDMIETLRMRVGGDPAQDAAVAGEALLRQVDDAKSSGGPLFERQQTRLLEIKKDYIAPFNQAWNTALANPRYADLTTGAGFTRKPATEWKNLRKGEADKLLKSAESDEAVRLLYEQMPAGSKNTLRRLQGLGKTKMESPNFTLKELNDARVALNEFASTTNNVTASKSARQLERGLEEQMNRLLREGASLESGIQLTRKVELEAWMNKNQYGDDLKLAWSQQKEAIQLANSQGVRSILEQRPEKVAEYLFNTTAKGSKKNTVVNDLMALLKRDGSDEVIQIQNGLSEYIQREILSNPNRTPFQMAKDFRKFVKDQEGTLKAVFGEKDFVSRFNNFRSFNKVIKGLEKTEQRILQIEARVGLSSADPDRRVANIVESILATGKTQKQSGIVLEDIKYITGLIKQDPILQEQMSQVTKRYLLQEMIEPRQGGGFILSPQKLNDLIYKGFGPQDVVGKELTFDNFIVPLLGKEGKDYVANLKVINEMVQREMGAAPSEGVVRDLTMGEYGAGANIEGIRMLQRLLIAPLTQTGRRITALSNSQANRSRKFIGRMLLDPVLFNEVAGFAKGMQSTQNFIRFLSSYGFVYGEDLASEMQYYDTKDKTQKTPEDKDELGERTERAKKILNNPMNTVRGIGEY